ncbi:MAG: rhomboid family intramembrane serine protease, partial [Herpetosiphonaceae bacterium]|nr:rhomboid family intramembrane serine protease [Herpetosiphonaceae bacterium]
YEAPPANNEPPQPQLIALPGHRVILVWIIFAINIGMFGYSLLKGFSVMGSNPGDDTTLINLGAKFSALIDLDGQWWRFLTAMILHGGLVHLAFNSYALYILGPEVERIYGAPRFAAIYLAAGLGGSVGSYVFGDLFAPSIGASGAIFGLLGALAAFAYSARETLGDTARRNLRQIAGVAAINLFIGFALPGIDNYAHLGGLIIGIVVGLLLAPQLRFVRNYDQIAIESQPSALFRWLGVIGALVILFSATSIVHQRRLADPAVVQELRDYRSWYLNALP